MSLNIYRPEIPQDVQGATSWGMPSSPETEMESESLSPRSRQYTRACPSWISDSNMVSRDEVMGTVEDIIISGGFLTALNNSGVILNADIHIKTNENGFITEIRLDDINRDTPDTSTWNGYRGAMEMIWKRIRISGGSQEISFNLYVNGSRVTVSELEE